MKYADVYLFPCATCGSTGASQVNSMVSSLKTNGCTQTNGTESGTQYRFVWLDIEGTQYWSSSTSNNQNFFQSLLAGCASNALNCGVYTSASQWNPIMGSSYSGGKSYPLWYAHYDNVASFSDFSPFGGWTTPYMKQYMGDVTVCGYDTDKDYTQSTPNPLD